MIEPATRSRLTARFEHKREVILDAAARVFNDKGLKGATLADVAAQVGLITTSVTYYYRRKEDLAAACLLRAIAEIDAIAAAAEAAPTPEARLTDFVRRYFARQAAIDEGREPELIGFNDIRALDGRHADGVRAAYADLFRRLRRLLRPSAGANFPRRIENGRTHLFFCLAVWMQEPLRRYETSDYLLAADRTADILIRGMAAPGSAWAPPALIDPAPTPEESGEISREAFLRAATELINDYGYPGASVDRISARLNVTKGSFYHHNDNKDDLVIDCFERSFETIRRTQTAAMALSGSGWIQITAAADALARRPFGEQGPLLHALALNAAPPPVRARLQATLTRLSDRFGTMLLTGMADGSIRPIDPSIAAHLIAAMISCAADLPRWAPGADAAEASEIYARPLFTGVLSA